MMTMPITREKQIQYEKDYMTDYRSALTKEMVKLGASDKELNLIKDATIRNAVKRNRKPEDVAWALLQ